VQEDDHEVNGIPCCSECGKPLDYIETMGEQQLLDHIRLNLLRDLARALATGTATHQEKAIAKALLRDNKSIVDPTSTGDDEEDDDEPGPEARPIRKARVFNDSKG
jgi:hypothetical protein